MLTDNYEILSSLGSGAFATVYKARRNKDKEIVALKCIDK
jgi:serine/threonine protein kinase